MWTSANEKSSLLNQPDLVQFYVQVTQGGVQMHLHIWWIIDSWQWTMNMEVPVLVFIRCIVSL